MKLVDLEFQTALGQALLDEGLSIADVKQLMYDKLVDGYAFHFITQSDQVFTDEVIWTGEWWEVQENAFKENPDKVIATRIKKKVAKNGGYCPCRIEKTNDTFCPCKEFRNQKHGYCHCHLYYKD